MLNARGGIECDFTVTRLGEETLPHRHRDGVRPARSRVARQSTNPRTARCSFADVTSQYACYGIWGPSAREILQPLTTSDLSNAGFPYMTCARARRRAVCRVSLFASPTSASSAGSSTARTEFGLALWDALWEAGREHGLAAGGYKAIDSLRLEKGYRVWGSDITPEDTPFEAGLDFAVKLDKGEFVGRECAHASFRAGALAALPDARRPSCGRTRLASRSGWGTTWSGG